MVQQFHSIHEIDPEFIPSIEVLLQGEMPSFDTLVQRHDSAPATDVFTYFLFFGPTQNTPIGFAQLCLRQIPSKKYISWAHKMKFWDKEHEHWKQLSWQVADGCQGLYVFDSKFSRTGKEKVQELIKEYEQRSDIMSESFYCLKGMQEFKTGWGEAPLINREIFVLEPFFKGQKTYQDYIGHLDKEVQKLIKARWKEIHKNGEIKLGDYPQPLETPKTLPIDENQLELWSKMGAQVLTFEKDLKVLGCLLILKGKNGNVFFEPFPFEPDGKSLVCDELYTQYALLKFFEMPEARSCHLMKFGSKLVFENKNDLAFFQEQGFQFKTIIHSFYSRLKTLERPI